MDTGLSTWLLQQNLQGVVPMAGQRALPDIGTTTDQWGLSDLLTDMNLGDWMKGLSGLGNLYLGFNQYGLAKDLLGDQMDMAKERWAMTKDELDRLKRVRSGINRQYAGSGRPYGSAGSTPYPAA